MREGKLKKISSLPMRDVGSRIPSLPSAATLDFRTKRIHIAKDVKFDEINIYYQIDSKSFRYLEEMNENKNELKDF